MQRQKATTSMEKYVEKDVTKREVEEKEEEEPGDAAMKMSGSVCSALMLETVYCGAKESSEGGVEGEGAGAASLH